MAYYNYEGLAGTVGETIMDQSGHGHDGVCRQDQSTLKAPTTWLKQQCGLSADLDGNGQVDLNDLGIFGDNWTPGQ